MEALQVIRTTFIAEFSDINDISQLTTITLRLTLAAVLGGLLGYEREQKGKAAGVRTHMLVSMGSALFVLIPQQAAVPAADLTRVLQGIVAGIGFLGAGSIINGNNKEEPRGMTTAAGIWMTAAIGVAAGIGREATALLSAVFALAILALVPKLTGGGEAKQDTAPTEGS